MASSPLIVTPWDAVFAAKAANPYNKRGGTIPKNLPVPPGTGSFGRFVHNVGYLIDLLSDPCQIDPWLLAIGSVPALLRMAWVVEEPDPKEVFHKLLGKSVVCSLKTEINERGTFDDFFWDGGKKTLFRTAEVADLAVWRLFLAGVLVDGLIDWQVMAQQESGCSGATSRFSSHDAVGAIPDISSPFPGNGFHWAGGSPGPEFTPSIQVKPGDEGYILWHAAVVADFGPPLPVPITAHIEDETGNMVDGPYNSILTDAGEWKSPIVYFSAPVLPSVARTYVLRARCAIEMPDHEGFFLHGFCAARGTVVD